MVTKLSHEQLSALRRIDGTASDGSGKFNHHS